METPVLVGDRAERSRTFPWARSARADCGTCFIRFGRADEQAHAVGIVMTRYQRKERS
jgi:hypothetical protein